MSGGINNSFNFRINSNINHTLANQNLTSHHDYLNKGKRPREESFSSGDSFSQKINDHRLPMAQGRGNERVSGDVQAYSKKMELVRKITDNFTKLGHMVDGIRDHSNNEFKVLLENLKSFTFEDYSKFFQALANIQYLSSLDESHSLLSRNKDSISINSKLIPFNPENLNINEDQFDLGVSRTNINDLVIKNEITGANLIQEKIKLIKTDVGIEDAKKSPSQSYGISLSEYLDNIVKNLKKFILEASNNEDAILLLPQRLKILIKCYTNVIHTTNKILIFEKEDKVLLDFLIEILNLDSNENFIPEFFDILTSWMFLEYFQADKENTWYRFDSILNEILSRLDSHKCKDMTLPLMDMPSWIKFISTLPRINKKVFDHVIGINDQFFANNYEQIKKMSRERKAFLDQLPHLKLMKQLYLEILKQRKIDESETTSLQDKMLNKFLDMTRNSDKHVNIRAIEFLLTQIYSLSEDRYEEKKIKKYTMNCVRELREIREDGIESQQEIQERFPLYLYLSGKDPEVVHELPKLYCESADIVRKVLKKYLPVLIKNVNKYSAEKLVLECNEKCEEIVVQLIEKMLKPTESMFNGKLNDEKLFRNIKKYYKEYEKAHNISNVLIALVDKIPLSDFFQDYNFILEKIKELGEDPNINSLLMNLFEKINSNANVSLYSPQLPQDANIIQDVPDKIVLYIIYYIINNPNANNFNDSIPVSDSIIKIFLRYYKEILLKSPSCNELFLRDASGIMDILSGMQVSLSLILRIVDMFIDVFKENSNVLPNALPGIQKIVEKLRVYLNVQANEDISQLTDRFIDGLIIFIKKQPSNAEMKENFSLLLDEKIKNLIRSKDFIFFSDL